RIALRRSAVTTKIARAPLEPLERNDISKLPGGIFSRAFVRSYAVEVGLDPDDTVRELLDRFDQDPPPPPAVSTSGVPEHEREFEEQRRKAGMILAGVVISIPVIALVLYFALRARAAGHAQPGACVSAATASA